MSYEKKDEIVITPGGPRPASTIHTVQPTDTVRLDETGFSVTAGGAKAVLAPGLVVTPGGPRLRSLIHNVESGYTLRVDPGSWKVLDLSGEIVKTITLPPVEEAPGLGAGWICATFWNNNTGSPFSVIRTTWSVPAFPTTESGQLIYLFNGLQVQVTGSNPALTGLHILQPVLQWGVSPDGGGRNWAVASWFVGTTHQPVAAADGGQSWPDTHRDDHTNRPNWRPAELPVRVRRVSELRFEFTDAGAFSSCRSVGVLWHTEMLGLPEGRLHTNARD
jgi:hypothetical protein